MTTTLIGQIEPEAVFLMSWLKPLIFAALLLGWGWVVSHLDKDAAYYYLPRPWLNLAQMGVGIVGFGLILLIPIFLVGLLLGLIVLGGGIVGYAAYRNTQVPEEARWTLSLDSFTRRIDAYQQAQAQRGATVAFIGPGDGKLDVPTGEEPFAAAHETLENVMDFALSRHAEQVELAVDSAKAVVFVRIDGVRYQQPAVEPRLALQLIDYLKSTAGLDVADRRKKQSGELRIDAGEYGRHRLELETAGSTRGLSLSLLIDPVKQVKRPLAELGLLDPQMRQLEAVLDEHGRLVLVAAPRRQGATTTLYSMLLRHDPYTTSVMTLESDPPFEAEGVSHNRIAEGSGTQQVNDQLASLLRSDPNVMLYGEPLEPATARTIAGGAKEVRFYAAVAEGDTFAALQTWVKLVGDRRKAAQALGAVVAQRLVRKLCTTCRTAYKPDPAALKKLNLPADRVGQLYRASGQVMVKDKPQPCPACMGLAYRGRVAVFELMPLDDQARGFLAAGEMDRLRAHLRKHKMLWLQEAALAKVVEGTTDIKEITRALGGGKASEANSTEKAAPA